MTDRDAPPPASEELRARFEAARPRLRLLASRMLGSSAEADDVVQQTWLRLARVDPTEIDNLDGWLTTVASRICLNVLRSRSRRPEVPLDLHVSDPVVRREPPGPDPEDEAILAESVGLALAVLLDELSPSERLAFVLHDVFAVSFDEVAAIMERSPAAARQLASRGRRRLRGDRDPSEVPLADPARSRAVVDAFFDAARSGDLDGLVSVLHPAVRLRADAGPSHPGTTVVRGAAAVGRRAVMFAGPDRELEPVWIGGDPGVVVTVAGRAVSVMRFAVVAERIVAIDALIDTERLEKLELPSGGSGD